MLFLFLMAFRGEYSVESLVRNKLINKLWYLKRSVFTIFEGLYKNKLCISTKC